MPKLYVILSVLGLVAFVAASTSAQEDLTLTTYYPAPYGVYNQMVTKTLGVGDTDGDGDLDSDDAPDTTDDPNELWVAGDVGIGTTNPQGRLTVYSTTNIDDYTDGITLHSNSGVVNSYFYHNTAGDLIIRKASVSDQLVLDSGGNVGIGTTDQFGGGQGILSLGNAAANPTSGLINAAALFASGGELYAYDAAGNSTQLSPHDPETGEWIFYSKNVKTGRVVRINMEKLVKKIEELTDEKFMEEWIEE